MLFFLKRPRDNSLKIKGKTSAHFSFKPSAFSSLLHPEKCIALIQLRDLQPCEENQRRNQKSVGEEEPYSPIWQKDSLCRVSGERVCVCVCVCVCVDKHTHTHTESKRVTRQGGACFCCSQSCMRFCLSVGECVCVCVCVWIDHANMLCGLRREVKTSFGENCSLLDWGLFD